MARYKSVVTFLLNALIWISVTTRGLSETYQQDGQVWQVVAGLLLAYALLLVTEPWVTQRYDWYPHLYLALQTGLVLILLVISGPRDYFALLFVPLSLRAMLVFPLRTGALWIVILAVAAAAGLIISYGASDAVPYMFIYAAALVFVASFAAVTQQAEKAQLESQALLTQLQEAHEQLQEYAVQAEELAVMEERNRLARDLHDSVTQAIFSLTLYAEAASRQLSAGALDVVADHLLELRHTAQQALQEMRLLIFELRPPVLENEGLANALQLRLEAVEMRAGMTAELAVHGSRQERLPLEIETGLYRIAQEALNNVLKHGQAEHVRVDLSLSEDHVTLEIADDGAGFDPAATRHGGGLGLRGMAERAEQMGGDLTVESEHDVGTRVKVEIAL